VVGVDKSVISPIVEPPTQPDAPKQPDEPSRYVVDSTIVGYGGKTDGAGTLVTPKTTPTPTPTPTPSLGDPIKVEPQEEAPPPPPPPPPPPTTTSTITETTTSLPQIPNLALGTVPLVPLSLGAAPRLGGGGGGGGGEEEAPVEEKKTSYLWLILLGIAGLIYFTKKKS
jgi:hypothetical protein